MSTRSPAPRSFVPAPPADIGHTVPMLIPTSSRRALLALVAGLLLTACSMDTDDAPTPPAADATAVQVRIGEIDWYVDYTAAQAVAREVDKPLWVHFGEHPG